MNKEKFFLYFDRLILSCLCFLIFFLPFAKAAAESFTWIAIFLWLFKRVLGYRCGVQKNFIPLTGLNNYLALFILANLLAVIFSTYIGLSLRAFFGKELKFIAIYFMLVEIISSKERLKLIFGAIIISATLIIIDGGVQYFTFVDFLRRYKRNSFCASFQTASGFAAWLIVIIPTFIGIVISKMISNVKLKILLLLLIVIQSFYLLLTLSRGAWLAFITAVIMIIFYLARDIALKVKILFSSIIICLVVVYFVLPQPIVNKVKDAIRVKIKISQTVNDRIKSIVHTGSGSNLIRIKLWKESLRIIKNYPLLGCGLNNYAVIVPSYKSFEGGGIYPHNSYLQMAAETGLLGLFSFLAVLFAFFRIGLRYLSQKRDYLVLGVLSGVLAFLIHAFFDTHLYSLQLVVLFWYMLGLSIAAINVRN